MTDRIEALERLVRLRDAGALTPDEFEDEKRRLFGRAMPSPAAGVPPAPMPPPVAVAIGEVDAEPAPSPAAARRPRAMTLVAGGVLAAVAIGGAIAMGSIDVSPPKGAMPEEAGAPGPVASVLPAPEPVPAPTAAAVDMSDTIGLSDAGNCRFAPLADAAFEKLLQPSGETADESEDRGWRPAARVRLGGASMTPGFAVQRNVHEEGDALYRSSVRFAANTRWHGLTLSRMARDVYAPPESDSLDTRRLTFLDPPATVQAALQGLGVRVPLDPDSREIKGKSCGGGMAVVPIPGGAALSCSWGC